MACGCGGKKSYAAIIKNGAPAPQASPFMGGQMSMSDTCTQENTIKIRYNGPTGNHLVASPLRKFPHYGMHTNGDIFCVHVDDQITAPNIFVLVPVEPPKPASPPVRPVVSEPVIPEPGVIEPEPVAAEVAVVAKQPEKPAPPVQSAKKRPQGRKGK